VAKKTITAEQYTCNNEACGTTVIATKDEPPNGYGGRVVGIDAGGGNSAEWWACSEDCIQPAVLGALAQR
jgi:hypothetical protein